ncbi:AraC family transcriptional regulator [Paenibacillus sp. GYB004]|uniref:AraC family transcriptional regulator n=1 Tax=Paenibacillus sp. GYB004 TaxID=2994393 RepID=UPI002F96DE51
MDIEVYFPNMTSTLQISGCGFGVKPPGWSYPMHHHHLFELLYCFSGEATQVMNNYELTLHSGDWIIVKSGARHQTDNRSDSPYSFFNIHFDVDDPELRRRLGGVDCGYLSSSEAETTGLPGYMKRIERIMTAGLVGERDHPAGMLALQQLDPLLKIELQACILLIVKEIAEQSASLTPTAIQKRPSAASSLETDIAHAVEERLQRMASPESEDSIAQIAKEMHMSRSQCTKIFTKVYGVSPRRYVSLLIANQAKHLLVTTSLSIEDISIRLGFRSLSHFSRQFRRWTGTSPLQYRPKHE